MVSITSMGDYQAVGFFREKFPSIITLPDRSVGVCTCPLFHHGSSRGVTIHRCKTPSVTTLNPTTRLSTCGQQQGMAPPLRPAPKRKIPDDGQSEYGPRAHQPSAQSQAESLPASKKRKSSKVSSPASLGHSNITLVLLRR